MKVEIPKSNKPDIIYTTELTDEHLIIAYKNNMPFAVLVQDYNTCEYYFMYSSSCDSNTTEPSNTIQECIFQLLEKDNSVTIYAYNSNAYE